MKQHEFVTVMNGADDRTLLLSDGRWENVHPFFALGFLQASPAPPGSSFWALLSFVILLLIWQL
jgi:hypothetical protein